MGLASNQRTRCCGFACSGASLNSSLERLRAYEFISVCVRGSLVDDLFANIAVVEECAGRWLDQCVDKVQVSVVVCMPFTPQNMDAEEFARHKSSLVSNKLTSDTSMGQEADRAWEQVFSTRYEFVSREQEAAMLQDVTLQVGDTVIPAVLLPCNFSVSHSVS